MSEDLCIHEMQRKMCAICNGDEARLEESLHDDQGEMTGGIFGGDR